MTFQRSYIFVYIPIVFSLLRLFDLANLFLLQSTRGLLGDSGGEEVDEGREGEDEFWRNNRQPTLLLAMVSEVRKDEKRRDETKPSRLTTDWPPGNGFKSKGTRDKTELMTDNQFSQQWFH